MSLHTLYSLLAFYYEHVISCKVIVFYHTLCFCVAHYGSQANKLVGRNRMVPQMNGGVAQHTLKFLSPVTKVIICFVLHIH